MYSLPAFWSMARENVDVVTIICNNASYAILQAEVCRQTICICKCGMRLTR